MTVRIINADVMDGLAQLADESVHAIVTDPPYHLTTGKNGGSGEASATLATPHGRARVTTGFMGMKWDGGDVAFRSETWREALRVLRPGGYLVAFGGTRTYHRLACAIEDAGFEVRDQLAWVYGSGFPKGTDKAKIPDDWQGWNTGLKPAWEPIVLARKPMIGTLAQNLQAHGAGALNVEGCRVDGGPRPDVRGTANRGDSVNAYGDGLHGSVMLGETTEGRWPANLLHDGSDEVLQHFPYSPGQQGAVTGEEPSSPFRNAYGKMNRTSASAPRLDTGSAARFFYCAKASREDRNDGLNGLPARPLLWSSGEQNPGAFQSPNTKRAAQNHHPTVKPTELMAYLVRLVTPPGGTVLDPFMGSGSTGRGALLEGLDFVGIEIAPEYVEIAKRRIRAVAPLFAEVA